MSRTYRWKMALGAVLLGGTAVLTTQGCTVTTGGDPFDGGPRPDTGTTDPVAQCNSCLFGQCSGQFSVCQGDSECQKIYQCAILCPRGDGNCASRCYDQYPAGKAEYRAMVTCNQYYACGTTCSSSCSQAGWTVGGACSVSPPEVDSGTPTPYDASAPLDCTTCQSTRCSSQKSQCGVGSACEDYQKCLGTCTDPNKVDTCIDDCDAAHSGANGGKAPSEALGNCTATSCKSECGIQ